MTGEWREHRTTRPTIVIAPLRNAASTLRDPELQQPRQTRYSQESQRRPDPTDVASATCIRNNSADNSHAGAHRRDDIGNPVDEIQERAFRLGPGLTLNRYVCLRRSAKVLSESHGLAHYQKTDCQRHGHHAYVLHFRVDLHRDSTPYRHRALLASLSSSGSTTQGLREC
jgi:hypothetical protein